MKDLTEDWIIAAMDDLKAANNLLIDNSLTHLVAFHAQQCVEKCFKAITESRGIAVTKTHDLIRLARLIDDFPNEIDMDLLYRLNELYVDSRYPGEMGLLPEGKPTKEEALQFCDFAEKILKTTKGLSKED